MAGGEDAAIDADGTRAADGRPAKAGRRPIENVVILAEPPLWVWSVITDFAGHPQWKPFVQLAGAAVEGGDATYSFRIGGLAKPVTSAADIVRVKKPTVFAWTAGVAKLLQFEETYELEKDPGGTRLRHAVCFHGFMSGVWTKLLRRRLKAGLVLSDRCLERQLRRPGIGPGAKPRTSAVGVGGRKTGRRR